MKKIYLSGFLALSALAVVITATVAFFQDREESSGNTFKAGAIDLKIDNTGYYNGELNEMASWQTMSDLDDNLGLENGKYLFFNFDDLKPGDWGEDTISLHVINNPSWLCSDVTLTSNLENDLTRPEVRLQDTDITGELANELNFIWWADDGDNVLEVGEEIINQSPLSGAPLNIPVPVILTDSTKNIWETADDSDNEATLPLPGNTDKYIATAWCYGNLTPMPLEPGQHTPLGRPENGGFSCDGSLVNDISQTDSATLDLVFYAIQSRHTDGYVCPSLRYPVTVSKTGNGTGTVTSNLAGIDCGTDCTEDYYRTLSVTLTPNPAANSNFTGWTGDCTGMGSCVLGINSAKNVTANFEVKTYTLTVSRTGTGSGTVSSNPIGISCGTDCSESYTIGTNLQLTQGADSGSGFTSWTGCDSVMWTPDGEICRIFNLHANRTVSADFTLPNTLLTVQRLGQGTGQVTSYPSGIDCSNTSTDCSENYLPNTNVTLYANPTAGHLFGGWGGACSDYQYVTQCSVNMNAAKTVTAKFVRQIGGINTLTFYASADTYVDDHNPAAIHGTETTFISKYITGSGGNVIDGLVKFDLSSIPSNMTVVSATLRLYANNIPAGNQFTQIYNTTSSWNESTIWSDLPDYNYYNSAYTNISSVDYQYWDVRTLAQQQIAQPLTNYGFLVYAGPGSTITFRSREYTGTSTDPELTVMYGLFQ